MPKPTSGITYAGEVIGTGDLFIARILEDSIGRYLAEHPFMLAPTAQIANATTMNQTPSYYSDQAFWIYNSEGVSTLTIIIPYLTAEMEAQLLGKTFDAATGRAIDTGKGGTVYFALLYRTPMSDGNDAFECWAKGTFAIPSQNRGQTKTDNVTPQQLTLTYAAVSTIHKFEMPDGSEDGFKKIAGDLTHPNFNPVDWFKAVQTPATAAPAPVAKYTVTVQPDTAGNGTVIATPSGKQAEGAILTITATAADGKTFTEWTDDAGGVFGDKDQPITTYKVPGQDTVVTANFT